MNRTMTAFAAVFAFAASTAIAQPQPTAPGAPVPAIKPMLSPGMDVLGKPASPGGPLGRGAPPAKDFATVKAESLKSIEGTLARLTKDRKCVTAAATPQALLECRRVSAAAHREMIDAQRARMGLGPAQQAMPGAPGPISRDAPRK